ncbi:MAG: putative bifunctional diguanylate cyclase/phosphodiesterase, partial [Acidimicrobiales bacterium]
STSGTLLSEADAAVSRAKELGRGQAAVFDESLRTKARALLEGEQALRAALDRGEVIPHFQPVVDLATGRPLGFEALARWVRGSAGPVPAEQWIAMAQKSGLIIELSEVVLAGALAEAADWSRRFPEQRHWVSVNVDASQLVETRLAEVVGRMLDVAGLDPHLLHLEITETVVMHDIDASVAVLHDLRDLGVHLCIDDFGTGYSSLSYLRHLPVDMLKVDRSFVAELGTAGGDPSIVKAVVGLTQALGLACVAEGVETEAQRDALLGVGCPLGQGFLWSRPMPAAAARAWLAGAAGQNALKRTTDATPNSSE